MFNKLFYLFIRFTFFISVIIFLSGCSEDDPVQHQEEHFEAIGVFIHNSGVGVVSILRGETEDTLVVPENNLSVTLSIQFYNDDEEIIDPPTSGQTIDFELDDTSIADIIQEPGFEFNISGKQKGNTHLELFLMHEGHSDFRSGKIPVRVE